MCDRASHSCYSPPPCTRLSVSLFTTPCAVACAPGIFAFWAGMMARLPRVAFGQSIALTAYDAIFKLLDVTFPSL